jgi:hypothetical protein
MKKWLTDHGNSGIFHVYKNCIWSKKVGNHTWCQRFCSENFCRFTKRHGLSMLPRTRVPQGMPAEYKIETLAFQKFVIAAWKRCCVKLGQIGNMDWVPVTFSVSSNRTVGTKGAKSITVKISGPEKPHYAAFLSCCINAIKMLLLLIFHKDQSGSMDENDMKLWLRNCGHTSKWLEQILCFWTFSIILSLSKNSILFIFQNTAFWRLDSVLVPDKTYSVGPNW